MSLVETSANLGSWIVLLAVCLVVARLILGPSMADRAVALDLLSVLTVAFAGLRAIVTGVDAYLDAAIILALVGFLGTLAFARFCLLRAIAVKDQHEGEI